MSHKFFVVHENNKMELFTDTWLALPGELAIEKYIVSTTGEGSYVLNEALFGEDLLFIGEQVITQNSSKRADILAIDKMGNAVIIELKKDNAPLGVETQALQYLSLFANFKGRNFVKTFAGKRQGLKEEIESFVVGTPIEEINQNSRIILVARGFDATLYSLGNWLFSKGVAFRCITYQPVRVGQEIVMMN
jgi:hypothetical protein